MSNRDTYRSSRKVYLKYLIIIAAMMSEVLAKKRSPGTLKQNTGSLVHPGTKWCGFGNTAMSYEDLGVAEEVDKCCRDHDHCQLSIPPSTWKYGLYNSDTFTNSDCHCDIEFRFCLKNVTGFKSIAATQVGLLYFTFMKPKCFFAMARVPCEKPYYDQFNNSYKHDGAGEYFCSRWYENVDWD